jgi:hypothetical protein
MTVGRITVDLTEIQYERRAVRHLAVTGPSSTI